MNILFPVGVSNAVSMTLQTATNLACKALPLLRVDRFDPCSAHEQSQRLKKLLCANGIPSDLHRHSVVSFAIGLSLNWFAGSSSESHVDTRNVEQLLKEIPRPLEDLDLAALDRDISRLASLITEQATVVIQSKDPADYRTLEEDHRRLKNAVYTARIRGIDVYGAHLDDWSYQTKQTFREDRERADRYHEGLSQNAGQSMEAVHRAMGKSKAAAPVTINRTHERLAELFVRRIASLEMYRRELIREHDLGQLALVRSRIRDAEELVRDIKKQMKADPSAKDSVAALLREHFAVIQYRLHGTPQIIATAHQAYRIRLLEESGQLEGALKSLGMED